MCISCKIIPLKFNQQIYSFGQKSTAVFTKCRTDFEPVPTLEFMSGSDKGNQFIFDHFPEILSIYLRQSRVENHYRSNIFQ